MFKHLITKPLRHLLQQSGLEIKRRSRQENVPTLTLDDPCDAIYQHDDIAFKLPLSHAMYSYLYSYGFQGWHPFIEVLKQHQNHPDLEYRDSILYQYYQRFHPQNVLDVFFAPEEQDAVLKHSGLAKLSIPPNTPIFPWDPNLAHISGERGLAPLHGHQGFGPVSDAKGVLELRRLVQTFESIRRHGYQPSPDHDGDIRGYFLRRPDDYRFIIRQGFHRTAVLAALGYENIRVKFYPSYPRVIFEQDADHWPQVTRGFLDLSTALGVFHKFFTEDGNQRAHRLGLLKQE